MNPSDRQEHPILFSGEMVRAIIEGRKTQTRRVIKPQPIPEPARIKPYGDGAFYCESNSGKVGIFNPAKFSCPYGKVGDKLWVQETWCPQMNIFGGEFDDRPPFYRADEEKLPSGHKWKPSIHMPRWASRITLEITDIRVERVQDISDDDAISEGMIAYEFRAPPPGSFGYPDKIKVARIPVGQFAKLWNSINEKRGYGWDKNPWVWAITFRRVK